MTYTEVNHESRIQTTQRNRPFRICRLEHQSNKDALEERVKTSRSLQMIAN